MQCFLQCFRCLSGFSAGVAKGNLLKTPAIVSLANFQILLRHLRLAFDWLPVHISDFQNPSGLTKLFMIILILVLKFIFKFHPVVCVATELNEKLFLIYSNEQLILLLKCLTTVAVLSNMTKLAGIFLMTDCQF